MKAGVCALALLASALPAFATNEGQNWGVGSSDDIENAWKHGQHKGDWHGGNPWAVANPHISKPEPSAKGSLSPDGTCGGTTGYTCKGSAWGDCCSEKGWCGSTEDYCGAGCNDAFGTCGVASKSKVIVTRTRKITTTICPTIMVFTSTTVESESTIVSTATVTTTVPFETYTVTEHPSGYSSDSSSAPSESAPQSYETSPAVPTSYSTAPGKVTITEVVTSYTTTCPVTDTITSDGTTSLTTYTTVSTVTSTISSTITDSTTESASSSSSVASTSSGSVTISNSTSSAGPTGTGSSSIATNSGNATTTAGPTGTASPSGTGSSSIPTNSGNATTTAGPTGTGSLSGTGTGFPTNSANATVTQSSSTSTSTCKSTPTNTDFCVPCQGQPGDDPKAWCGYDINVDSYKFTPKTCGVVEYHFTVTNETIAPDGVERLGLVINGQFPGPTIEANWGDTIIVHLTNGLQNNGTSLHFHGMRQFNTNEMDGVPSITQCALAPGDSMTYKFIATNHGTSWYHSHWGLQIYDGVFGPMVIHGPSSKEYDVDAGPIVMSDWNHVSVNELYDASQQVTSRPGTPTLDTGLINGKNVWGSGGERFEMEFESGKAYLLRLINCGIQATFTFSIDGHKFWVVSTDYVPIVPYETDSLTVNIGQRYNIIVVADQAPAAYWMRADNQLSCSPITQYDDIKGIVRYKATNSTSGLPITLPNASAVQGSCADAPAASLVPVVAHTVGPQQDNIHENVLIGPGPSTPNLYKWTLNGATFQSQWGAPTLNQIFENGTVPDYSGNLAIEIPNLGEWVYIIIETPIPVPHPIHLHGHDFYVLTAGIGPWNGDTSVFQLNNPPRRDVAMMPGGAGPAGVGGHLVLAFYTDNPGAWLMHCHIGWHSEMGFALQIIENLEGIKKLEVDTCKMQDTCKNWNAYAQAAGILTIPDSGI